MVATILVVLSILLYYKLSQSEKSKLNADLIGFTSFVIQGTLWITGLFVLPLLAFVLAVHYNKDISQSGYAWTAIALGVISFLVWKKLITLFSKKEKV